VVLETKSQNNYTTEISGKTGRMALTNAMDKNDADPNFKYKNYQNQLLVVAKLNVLQL
jgi:hypothetical protein